MAHICHYLSAAAGKSPTKLLTVCGDRRKAAHQVQARVAALAAALTDTLAVQPGDVVALALDSTDFFLECLLAVAAAGGISAPLNLRWSSTDAAAAISLCQARLILLDAANLHFHDLVGSPGCICCRQAVFVGPEPRDGSGRYPCVSEHLIQQRIGTPLLLKQSPDGGAIICFTSGTTGQPKGVLISHTALHCQAIAKLMVVGYNSHDVYMHAAPLFHIGGLSSAIALLMAGGTHVFMGRFNAAGSLSIIARYQVTAFIAVPAMMADLTEAASGWAGQAGNAGPSQFPSVHRILVGAGGLSSRQVTEIPATFPQATVHSAYGMTEACSSMTFKLLVRPACSNGWPPTTGPARPHANLPPGCGVHVGAPPPGIEIAVLKTSKSQSEAADEPIVHGITSAQSANGVNAAEASSVGGGELLTRGPHVLMRYWGQTVETSRVMLPGGWFRTGDIGRVDMDGCVWLQGRVRDVIRSGGESVHAVEVEQVLSQHPAVLTAAVFGVPHQRFGEQVAAVLRLDRKFTWTGSMLGETNASAIAAQPVTMAGVQDFCRQASLSSYKLPRVIAVQYEPLPVNASGKVLKLKLKSALLEEHLYQESASPKQGTSITAAGPASTALSKL
ncbi:hypothetical protein ABBQ38_001316 [Trebouxia sp. C0009 RCD-2024]